MQCDCITFLQWALPHLQMEWKGFRKVRGQVCKRLHRRLKILSLPSLDAYRQFLESNPSEWQQLDKMCRISITRFYRDQGLFNLLKDEMLPNLAKIYLNRDHTIRIWSAGCASGEEAYTLALIWHFVLRDRFPRLQLEIVATDIDAHLLFRAKQACYPPGCLRDLPKEWREEAFILEDGMYCLRLPISEIIFWMQQDIRKEKPSGQFDIIFCRNLVATYFQASLQIQTFQRLESALKKDGFLILGVHEELPSDLSKFTCVNYPLKIYQLTA